MHKLIFRAGPLRVATVSQESIISSPSCTGNFENWFGERWKVRGKLRGLKGLAGLFGNGGGGRRTRKNVVETNIQQFIEETRNTRPS